MAGKIGFAAQGIGQKIQAGGAAQGAHGALGGGVSRSLSVDNYGKALSAAILGFELLVPAALAPLLRRRAPG